MLAPSACSSTKMRLASRSASLMARMAVICEPMWKCRSCRQSSMPSRAQPLDRRHHLGGGEAELRAVARRLHPLARALGGEPRAHADDRADVEVARGGEDGLELAHAVHDDDDLAAELLGEQRGLDVGAVLVPVAEDERLGVVLQGERDQQLGLGAGLEPEVEGPAVLDQLLDHVALLVDLDRVDAAVGALVVVLGDRLLERRRRAARRACAGCRRSG